MSMEHPSLHKANIFVCFLIVVALVAIVMIGLAQERLPSPVNASADRAEFSSGRALSYLRQIARKPHPIGTAEHDEVKKYIVDELNSLGLSPQIQAGLGTMTTEYVESVGMIQNIIVRIPGSVPGKAILLSAHYDSVPNSRGAADNGASVAAVLETLRALKNRAPLRNDLIAIFTDGEEIGLLGAELFTAEHSWANDVGLVLNFEYRGSSGPMLMFETSVGNGKLISGYASSVTYPASNSLLYEIYRLLPNDTDMSVYKRARMPGMNFAAIENATSYHMPLDSPERLNEGTLQSQGDTMLSLVQHFGNISLEELQSEDSVYFSFPIVDMVHYSADWIMPLSGLVILLFVIVLMSGIRSGEIRLAKVFVGMSKFLMLILFSSLCCQLLWLVIGLVHPEYQLFDAPYNSHWYLLAFSTLAVATFAWAQRKWQHQLRMFELAMGTMLFLVLLLLVVSVFIPGASYLLTWSILPMLIVFAVLLSTHGRRLSSTLRATILLIGSAPAIVIFSPIVRLLFNGLGPQIPLVTVLAVGLLLGVISPLLMMLTQRLVLPLLPTFVGSVFLVAGSATAQFDEEKPLPTNLFYAFDGASGNAFWVSRDDELDNWNRTLFPSDAVPRSVPEIFGPGSPPYWIGPAPVLEGLQAPIIEVVTDTKNGNIRDLSVRVKSSNRAPNIVVRVDGADVLSSRVQGKPMTNDKNSDWKLDAYAMADEWLTVELKLMANNPFQVRVYDQVYSLPLMQIERRPPALIANIHGTSSDSIRTVQVKRFD